MSGKRKKTQYSLALEPVARGETPPALRIGRAWLFLHGALQHANGAIVDLQRHWIGMPVLAAMGDRKSCGIAEAVGRAMYDLGDLGQRSDGPCADAWHEQKL